MHGPLEHAVDLDPWRDAAAALALAPSYHHGHIGFHGRHEGHDVTFDVTPADTARAWVAVRVRAQDLAGDLVVTPLALAPTREGRFLTGDPELDRAVAIHGSTPLVAAPWDAATRALALKLVTTHGLAVTDRTARIAAFGAARATADRAVLDTIRDLLALVGSLTRRVDPFDLLEEIATSDPLPIVRAQYSRLLAEAAPASTRDRTLTDRGDAETDDVFDGLMRTARTGATLRAREDAIVELLATYPPERVESLLLSTEDKYGVRVRDALIAAIHRGPPPVSPVALLHIMARSPMGPGGLQVAAHALGAAEDPAGAARLASLSQHPEAPVWRTALASLMRLRLSPTAALNWIADANCDALWDHLPDVAVDTRPRHAGAILLALLDRPELADATRQVHVIDALAQLAYEPARTRLQAIADHEDRDPAVALAAADALDKLDAALHVRPPPLPVA